MSSTLVPTPGQRIARAIIEQLMDEATIARLIDAELATVGNDWLTITQAAERLGVSGRRVQQLIYDESLVAQKVGKIWLIERASLAAYAPRRRGRPRKMSHA